ncbi:topless-related protein 4-like protein isoform X3 [Tanacetum coccineum]
MASLSRELVLLIHQFLDEEKYKRTLHMLEMESGHYFNMRYFEEVVTNGEWEEVVKYLHGFTKVEDNRYSMKIFFEIQKQKFLEALDRNDHPKACEMLRKDLKVFSGINQELYKEITLLLGLENFRENEQLSKYADAKTARSIMLVELKKLIEANPVFRDKLTYPSFKNQRLRTLINQRFPIFAVCDELVTDMVMCQHTTVVKEFEAEGSIYKNSYGINGVDHSCSILYLSCRRGRTPTNTPALEYRTADEHAFKRTRAFGISDEVNHPPVNVLPVGYSGQSRGQSSYSSDDLPKAVVMTLDLMSSSVSSMDFHPIHQVLLLVGTNNGEIMIWDLRSREKLVQKNFKASKIGSYSTALQTTLANDYTASINRVTWSPDGKLFGVAYSKSLVQIYSYHGGDDIRNHLEIEAHAGSVNDLAFAYPNKILSIVTCGDDKLIKVWDAVTGAIQNEFEGHEAPVYSVCPHFKENIQFVFSTAIDGKIKAFLYDNAGPRVNYDAPGQSSTRLAYSADGTRLFSCGTNKQGDSFIVEWNESEGTVKHSYNGLGKQAIGVVQFDTTKDRFIAAGDEGLVKFWDMDNSNLLMTVDSEGGLLTSPIVRFNKDGMLLAVSIHANGIKILANPDGVKLLRTTDNSSFDPSGVASTPVAKVLSCTDVCNNHLWYCYASGGPSMPDKTPSMPPMTLMNSEKRNLVDRPRIGDEAIDKSRMWKVTEISEPSQCLSSRLPDNTSSMMRVTNLVYTNSGLGVLALVANAVHKLWKWPKNDRNTSGKATASVLPQLWQPTSGILMTNDISDTNPEDSIACFTLSKNDSYVISASGGKISLFNMMTFKTMTTFMPPPPAATFLAFHPVDNNIVAIGMDDASIQIFSVRLDEVMAKLKGHQKRITGLAFSNSLGVLVSSGADAILCVWNINGYEKQTSKQLHIPGGRVAARSADTRVQFHQDQTHLLVVHETQIAIFEAPRLECLKQWGPREASGPITNATYSCDSQSIYVTFEDGSIDILTASTLRLRCRISSTAYLPSNPTTRVYPLVVAAHPSEPNQFALGLTDGGVCVIEPLESEGKWGTSAGPESVAGPSTTTGGTANTTDQSHRVSRSEVHDTVMDSKYEKLNVLGSISTSATASATRDGTRTQLDQVHLRKVIRNKECKFLGPEIMKKAKDIENMTIAEYMEYEAELKRQSRRSARLNHLKRYAGTDLNYSHCEKDIALEYPHYSDDAKIDAYYDLPPASLSPVSECRAVYANNDSPIDNILSNETNELHEASSTDNLEDAQDEEDVPSKILPCQLPPKELNLGSFTLPCTIGSLNFYAMADLGASVNVIPKSMFKILKLIHLKKTNMLVEMEDMTKKVPIGILENVLVMIDKFLFSSDFVVIDMLEARNETVILGRPFLATIHAKINVFNKEISLGFEEGRITFDMNKKIHNFTTLVEKVHVINSIQDGEPCKIITPPPHKSPLCLEVEGNYNLHN